MKEKTKIASGAYEGAKANNIYDLAGNVWLWTLETFSLGAGGSRYGRGGCYNFNGTTFFASSRDYNGPYDSYSIVGFCGTLYIK